MGNNIFCEFIVLSHPIFSQNSLFAQKNFRNTFCFETFSILKFLLTGRQEEGRTRWRFRAGWKQYKRKAGKERRETGKNEEGQERGRSWEGRTGQERETG